MPGCWLIFWQRLNTPANSRYSLVLVARWELEFQQRCRLHKMQSVDCSSHATNEMLHLRWKSMLGFVVKSYSKILIQPTLMCSR